MPLARIDLIQGNQYHSAMGLGRIVLLVKQDQQKYDILPLKDMT